MLNVWELKKEVRCSKRSTNNTVAGYCEFGFNIRFASKEQFEFIEKKVEELKTKVFVEGCTTEVERLSYRTSMPLTERNLKLANDMNSAFEKYGLEKLEIIKGNGCSDAADATELGLTAVDSLGVSGGKIHSPGEYSFLEDLKKCAKQVVAMILEIN